VTIRNDVGWVNVRMYVCEICLACIVIRARQGIGEHERMQMSGNEGMRASNRKNGTSCQNEMRQ